MFIQDLGADYADDNLSGALFVYNGRVMRVSGITSREVQALDILAGETVRVEPAEITGWRTFKYPRLGFRRFDDKIVGTVSRSSRSYTRGLCYDNLRVQLSPSSAAAAYEDYECDSDEIHYVWKDNNWNSVCLATMSPTYDGKDEFAELMRGERESFVPSHSVLMDRDGSKIKVSVLGGEIGWISGTGKIVSSPNNGKIISDIVRKYAR